MQLPELRGGRRHADQAFRWVTIAAAGLVLLILALVASSMTQRALPVFEKMGTSFFSSKAWSPAEETYGALAFVFGTLYTALIALALAVPISLGVALFTTQVAPRWLSKPLVYLIDLCAVVPSV